MSYFNLELIQKIKSINCYQMPTAELAGIFKNREVSIDESLVSWFNASEGQYNDELHYLEFDNSTPTLLNYGKYIETIPGVKVKTQTGVLTLTENFNLFSINQPYNKGIHISLENEMYKDIKCTYTESENPEKYLNKIFKFSTINEEGALVYAMQNPPEGKVTSLSFNVLTHKFIMQTESETPIEGIETNDNSLFLLAVNDVSNAFNDYFQFAYYSEEIKIKKGRNSTVIRKK